MIEQNENESFEQWARSSYEQLLVNLKIVDETNSISPVLINRALVNFSQSYSWLITISEIESNKLNIMTHSYDRWYQEQYNKAFRTLREEAAGAGRAPAQATVDARITQMNGDEKSQKLYDVEMQKSRVELLKSFVKVLDKHAAMITALSSNMRSELFFAAGVPLEGRTTPAQKTKVAHAHMADAMGEIGVAPVSNSED